MAVVGASSSVTPKPSEEKPVIVRVKRKALQSPLDAFWLEINERPQKRPLLDFENLSLSDSSGKAEELKTKVVLVRHVETVSSSDTTVDVVKSFVDPNSDYVCEHKTKSEERRQTFKKENKQDHILFKARLTQEVVAKNARFEQIWRSRKGNKETSREKLHAMCNFYDVIRVDAEEKSNASQQQEEISLEDERMLNSYLPLLREFIPSAASEIELDLSAHSSKQASEDEYVYDLYAVKEEEMDIANEDSSNPFPLVQVDDEDIHDGPDESDYETDDSNAENNPLNDYPDGSEEEEEEESENEASDDESEEKSSSDESSQPKDSEGYSFVEDDMYDHNGDGVDFDYDVDQIDGGEDLRWSSR